MKRRSLILGLAATLATAAGGAFAETYAEDVVHQLARLGFSDITVETTLLGRIKILATRGDGIREIVLNPRTGEILRDVWFPSGKGGQVRRVLNDIEDDDGDSDDGDSDDGDDGFGDDGFGDDGDNSGHGSGGDDGDDDNSGSGGGDDDDDRDREDRDEQRDD